MGFNAAVCGGLEVQAALRGHSHILPCIGLSDIFHLRPSGATADKLPFRTFVTFRHCAVAHRHATFSRLPYRIENVTVTVMMMGIATPLSRVGE